MSHLQELVPEDRDLFPEVRNLCAFGVEGRTSWNTIRQSRPGSNKLEHHKAVKARLSDEKKRIRGWGLHAAG